MRQRSGSAPATATGAPDGQAWSDKARGGTVAGVPFHSADVSFRLRWGARGAIVALVGALLCCALPAQAADDPTVTRKARISQNHRATIDLKTWKSSDHGRDISRRESGNACDAVSTGGDYRGKWQMTRSLWRSYGGKKFARVPNRATCGEQDRVARHVWVDQWWWPWGG
jgi:hypothetical protein